MAAEISTTCKGIFQAPGKNLITSINNSVKLGEGAKGKFVSLI